MKNFDFTNAFKKANIGEQFINAKFENYYSYFNQPSIESLKTLRKSCLSSGFIKNLKSNTILIYPTKNNYLQYTYAINFIVCLVAKTVVMAGRKTYCVSLIDLLRLLRKDDHLFFDYNDLLSSYCIFITNFSVKFTLEKGGNNYDYTDLVNLEDFIEQLNYKNIGLCLGLNSFNNFGCIQRPEIKQLILSNTILDLPLTLCNPNN